MSHYVRLIALWYINPFLAQLKMSAFVSSAIKSILCFSTHNVNCTFERYNKELFVHERSLASPLTAFHCIFKAFPVQLCTCTSIGWTVRIVRPKERLEYPLYSKRLLFWSVLKHISPFFSSEGIPKSFSSQLLLETKKLLST